jgi:DNA-binding CsgD family transcriptional regulator
MAEDTVLLGRRAECQSLDALLADAGGGASRVLVLRGDAGVGKSALLRYLSERAQGWCVLSATGVESELELAYSGLHQLCSPLLEQLDRLPAPQRQALATVFGLSLGPAPDRFLVGLATLSLLADAADRQPLICLVDDAQWLDRATAQVLAFVGRRLLAERIALICAGRTGAGEDLLPGLPELAVGGLGDEDARELLLGGLPGALDAAVFDQIIAESHGNPLALLELPRSWRTVDLAGGFGLPHSRPVAGRIEQSYVRRLRECPTDTQVLVLAAAAEPLGDLVLLDGAARRLGVDLAAAAPAVDAGLLWIGGRVEFTHPLVRSGVYRAAAVVDRRRVHSALAEGTNLQTDPDRRAWHRARATAGPDEEVAAELERSAGRAQSRAGLAAAAAFLTRAAELTPDPSTKVRRALDAGFAAVAAGTLDPARAQLTVAAASPVDEWQQARTDLLRAQLNFASSRGRTATPALLAAARRLEPLDVDLARETYLDALIAAQIGSRLNDGIDAVDVAEAAHAVRRRPDAESTSAGRLLAAFSALTVNYQTAVPLCRAVLRGLRGGDEAQPEQRLRWLWEGTILAIELWDDDSWYFLSDHGLRIARAAGALQELPFMLGSRIQLLGYCGELSTAAALSDENESVLEAMGVSGAPYGAVCVAAWRGRADEAYELAETAIGAALANDEGTGVAVSECWKALLYNGLGRYDEALAAALSATADPRELSVQNWGLPELIEAATRTGQADLATNALDRLAERTQASGTRWALGVEARARALLSDGDTAEGLFLEAIGQLSRTRTRAELARTHLLYGEWLRRVSRRADAKQQLSAGFEMFSGIGMAGFAERAHRELLALGAAVRSRQAESRDDLTAQEAQIARLARDGLSNPEIGAQLFLSARTIEWHLRKVFAKLGISSRRQLRGARIP